MTNHSTMRALQVEYLSDDLSGVGVRTVPRPEPAAGQVQIKVEAASLNYPDLLMTRGEYQMKPEPPFTIGGMTLSSVIEIGLLPSIRIRFGLL
jgi:NADPH2:quinone reductase